METKTKIIVAIGSFLGIGTLMSSIAWVNGKIEDAKREEEERIRMERFEREHEATMKKLAECNDILDEKLREAAVQMRIENAIKQIEEGKRNDKFKKETQAMIYAANKLAYGEEES